jgi:factor associated with neutral sphingomyelinase activation
MLKLQSGRFDKPDRLFKSIIDDWANVMENPTSVKELIPEFYMKDIAFLKKLPKPRFGSYPEQEASQGRLTTSMGQRRP